MHASSLPTASWVLAAVLTYAHMATAHVTLEFPGLPQSPGIGEKQLMSMKNKTVSSPHGN